ncbi:MAG TPA: hypothetical protein VEX63_06225, partial [Flavisolibacter sp.]|nr:hypothetical protein [Flavisolibacter sp.]
MVLLISTICFGQQLNIPDNSDSLLNQYATQYESAKLHLHLDKTIYTSNETIWFSAYLFHLLPDNFQHSLLYIKLVREENDSLVRSHIYPIVDNHSYGSILLPVT